MGKGIRHKLLIGNGEVNHSDAKGFIRIGNRLLITRGAIVYGWRQPYDQSVRNLNLLRVDKTSIGY